MRRRLLAAGGAVSLIVATMFPSTPIALVSRLTVPRVAPRRDAVVVAGAVPRPGPGPTGPAPIAPAPHARPPGAVAPLASLPVLPPLDSLAEQRLFAFLMSGPHRGAPHGVPGGWSWGQHPEVDARSNGGMAAITAWGQIYADATSPEPPPSGVRVEIKDIRSLIWSTSARAWFTVQASATVGGRHFVETYAGNRSVSANDEVEVDGETSVSMFRGYNFHFWPVTGRAGVIAGDVGAVITLYEARLIGPDASTARYLANAGADWWRSATAPFNHGGVGANNAQIGEGRFVYLSTSWTTVGFYTGGP